MVRSSTSSLLVILTIICSICLVAAVWEPWAPSTNAGLAYNILGFTGTTTTGVASGDYDCDGQVDLAIADATVSAGAGRVDMVFGGTASASGYGMTANLNANGNVPYAPPNPTTDRFGLGSGIASVVNATSSANGKTCHNLIIGARDEGAAGAIYVRYPKNRVYISGSLPLGGSIPHNEGFRIEGATSTTATNPRIATTLGVFDLDGDGVEDDLVVTATDGSGFIIFDITTISTSFNLASPPAGVIVKQFHTPGNHPIVDVSLHFENKAATKPQLLLLRSEKDVVVAKIGAITKDSTTITDISTYGFRTQFYDGQVPADDKITGATIVDDNGDDHDDLVLHWVSGGYTAKSVHFGPLMTTKPQFATTANINIPVDPAKGYEVTATVDQGFGNLVASTTSLSGIPLTISTLSLITGFTAEKFMVSWPSSTYATALSGGRGSIADYFELCTIGEIVSSSASTTTPTIIKTLPLRVGSSNEFTLRQKDLFIRRGTMAMVLSLPEATAERKSYAPTLQPAQYPGVPRSMNDHFVQALGAGQIISRTRCIEKFTFQFVLNTYDVATDSLFFNTSSASVSNTVQAVWDAQALTLTMTGGQSDSDYQSFLLNTLYSSTVWQPLRVKEIAYFYTPKPSATSSPTTTPNPIQIWSQGLYAREPSGLSWGNQKTVCSFDYRPQKLQSTWLDPLMSPTYIIPDFSFTFSGAGLDTWVFADDSFDLAAHNMVLTTNATGRVVFNTTATTTWQNVLDVYDAVRFVPDLTAALQERWLAALFDHFPSKYRRTHSFTINPVDQTTGTITWKASAGTEFATSLTAAQNSYPYPQLPFSLSGFYTNYKLITNLEWYLPGTTSDPNAALDYIKPVFQASSQTFQQFQLSRSLPSGQNQFKVLFHQPCAPPDERTHIITTAVTPPTFTTTVGSPFASCSLTQSATHALLPNFEFAGDWDATLIFPHNMVITLTFVDRQAFNANPKTVLGDEFFIDLSNTSDVALDTTTTASTITVRSSSTTTGLSSTRWLEVLRALKLRNTQPVSTWDQTNMQRFYIFSLSIGSVQSDARPVFSLNLLNPETIPRLLPTAPTTTFNHDSTATTTASITFAQLSDYISGFNNSRSLSVTFADGTTPIRPATLSIPDRNSITFSNLPPGVHHIHLKANNTMFDGTTCGSSDVVVFAFTITQQSNEVKLNEATLGDVEVCQVSTAASAQKILPTVAFANNPAVTTSLAGASFVLTATDWSTSTDTLNFAVNPPQTVSTELTFVSGAPRMVIQASSTNTAGLTVGQVLDTLRALQFSTTSTTAPHTRDFTLTTTGVAGVLTAQSLTFTLDILSSSHGLPTTISTNNNVALSIRPAQNNGQFAHTFNVTHHWTNPERIVSATVSRVDGTTTSATFDVATGKLSIPEIFSASDPAVTWKITLTNTCQTTNDDFRFTTQVGDVGLDIATATSPTSAVCHITQGAVHDVYTQFVLDTAATSFDAPRLSIVITLQNAVATDRLAFASTYTTAATDGVVGTYTAATGVFTISAAPGATPTTAGFQRAVLEVQYSTTLSPTDITTTTRTFTIHTTTTDIPGTSNVITTTLSLTTPAQLPSFTSTTNAPFSITIPFAQNAAGFSAALTLSNFYTNTNAFTSVGVYKADGSSTTDISFVHSTNTLSITLALPVGVNDYKLIAIDSCGGEHPLLLQFNVQAEQTNPNNNNAMYLGSNGVTSAIVLFFVASLFMFIM